MTFGEVDFPPIFKEAACKSGVGGDLLVEDAEFADNLINDVIEGKFHFQLLIRIECK